MTKSRATEGIVTELLSVAICGLFFGVCASGTYEA